MKTRSWALAAAALVAVGAIAYAMSRPVAVRVVAAQQGPIARTLVFSGRVATPIRVDLGATLTGRVAEVRVREGARVGAGDLLAQLESDEIRAQLSQAEASLRLAQARLAGQREVARPSSDAALSQANANLEAARREAQRSMDLLDRGYVSQARVDETRRAVQVAQAQVDSARASALANAPAGTETAQAQLRIQEASAAVALAQARLGQTRIVAPADGRIVQRNVDPGQIVQPGKPLFLFAATGATQLIGQADEKFLGELAPGQTAQVVVDAFPSQPFVATLVSIAPGIDAQRGTVEVKFQVESPPPFLREDMTLSLSVQVGSKPSAITLPAATVIGAGAQGAVRTIADGRVVEMPVRIGLRTLDRVEVVSGVAPGQSVLADPLAIDVGKRARAARADEAVAGASAGGTAARRGGGDSATGSGPAAAMGAAAGAR
jgi:HlyD family secretion protein